MTQSNAPVSMRQRLLAANAQRRLRQAATIPQASLSLDDSSMSICLAREEFEWSLDKRGQYDASTQQICWTVSAAKTPVPATHHLVVGGLLKIRNSGAGPATVGNIVVTVQKKFGPKWRQITSDIADKTVGDFFPAHVGTRSAYICPQADNPEGLASFKENSYSGPLEFFDDDSNSVFSLANGYTLQPLQTRFLGFRAEFRELQALLAPNEQFRVQAIVTFGNAGARGNSSATSGAVCHGIDHDGDGTADNNIRSVPIRQTFIYPTAATLCNDSVLLQDSDGSTNYEQVLSDSAEVLLKTPAPSAGVYTDCAALTAPATSVLVSVCTAVDALTGSCVAWKSFTVQCCPPIDLLACAEVLVEVEPPFPSFCSYSQGGFGGPGGPYQLLAAAFPQIWSVSNPLQVGIGNYMQFNSAPAVQAYLPAGGPPSALTATLINPTSSSSGVFGGQVLTLKINLALDDLQGAQARIGELTFCPRGQFAQLLADYEISPSLAAQLDGWTVRQILDLAERVLGGSVPSPSAADLNALVEPLAVAFHGDGQEDCTPSLFAAGYLCNP